MSSPRLLASATFEVRVLVIIGLGLTMLGVGFCLPRLSQDPSYHQFADDRTLLDVPNLLNVASNAPFVLIGVAGWLLVLRRWWVLADRQADAAIELGPWLALFTGVLLTGFGSAYYHLQPTNERLVWDRLPMTIAFMSFFAIMIADRISLRAGAALLLPLLLVGIGSLVNWQRGLDEGVDDLRLYLIVQFFPMVATPLLLLLFPPRYTRSGFVWGALAWYGAAKILELPAIDRGFYALGHVVSGHSLKHLAAACGAYWILWMFCTRRPVQESKLLPVAT